MNGIKFSQYISQVSINTESYADAIIDHSPKKKYRYENKDPFAPNRYIRYGEFYEDDFDITLHISADEIEDLIDILRSNLYNPETHLGMYLEFDQGGETLAFPITKIVKEPSIPDDVNEYNGTIKFKLQSSYIVNPGLPAFSNYGAGLYGSGAYGW